MGHLDLKQEKIAPIASLLWVAVGLNRAERRSRNIWLFCDGWVRFSLRASAIWILGTVVADGRFSAARSCVVCLFTGGSAFLASTFVAILAGDGPRLCVNFRASVSSFGGFGLVMGSPTDMALFFP